ncbi:RNA polymerase sigma-70 factor, ECF subfamily [Lutibacter oricola]|uniref:RNA polymerase sigma-70 factor, ECF subfamily n=1 Tax=Lutibacter oricola TaxID=762486 RepID=A0A1H2SNT9_9FLAO|nr:sigma-70 family RNA polymerase sigma factor [Lutibacter oricola]SDW33177.1 RNA polymerase sigma-70 factor, ECF subfamily [Lutibacter oricola]
MKYSNKNIEIATLIEENRRLIYKVVNSYCTDVNEQEDLIQEIIFQIINSYQNFDHKVKTTTWMYKIAFNVAISHYRKTNNRKKYFAEMPSKVVTIEETYNHEMDEKVKMLRQFIQEFDPLNKAILIMYLDGNSHTEISKVVGISVSNVGTKIGRIKKQLQKKFKK